MQRHSSRTVENLDAMIELVLTYVVSIFGMAVGLQFLLSYGTAVMMVFMIGAVGVILLGKNGRDRRVCLLTQAV